MNKIKSNKGFTLIEIIVSFSIGVIIIMATSSLWMFSNSMFEENKAITEQRRIFDATQKYITEELAFATDIYIADSLNDIDKKLKLKKLYFDFNEAQLYTEYSSLQTSVFGTDFYMDNIILQKSINGVDTGFGVKSDDVITVTMTLNNKRTDIATTENFDVRLNNIKLSVKSKEPFKYEGASGHSVFYIN